MRNAIIIDSSAGVKNVKDYKDLYLAPLMITKENGEQIADDENLTQDEFYNLYEKEMLKTSQTIPGEMMKLWDKLLESYDKVICLLLSKGLSGQYSTCKMLSEEEKYKGKILVVDTNGVSIVLKKQLLQTIDLLKEGEKIENICNILEKDNKNFNVFIIPKKLDQLVRGGRISKAAAGLAKILKITPILKYDGTIDKEAKTRTFKKAIEDAVLLLKKKQPNSKIIDISFSKSSEELINTVKEIVNKHGFQINLFEEIPNTITCHTGLETFALGVWRNR
ncbi:DegV family protein [Spiroplasma turonicum]|uniref:DegV family protein n=1 Tax=Spiroplasma turonicum TaxID=216946 RepID=A0A0K1P502_9MOLU|nr:DegV family protein [Spiroplasma turonicum]AKU79391.1 DegV family protein [Spiroplasma turonicum]ALX70412.1 fatty acid-binding protein DegV [Spiroplasma turonicum]